MFDIDRMLQSHVARLQRQGKLGIFLLIVNALAILLNAISVYLGNHASLVSLVICFFPLYLGYDLFKKRACQNVVWLQDHTRLDEAIEATKELGWRHRRIDMVDKSAFTFTRKKDAVWFKLGWG